MQIISSATESEEVSVYQFPLPQFVGICTSEKCTQPVRLGEHSLYNYPFPPELPRWDDFDQRSMELHPCAPGRVC